MTIMRPSHRSVPRDADGSHLGDAHPHVRGRERAPSPPTSPVAHVRPSSFHELDDLELEDDLGPAADLAGHTDVLGGRSPLGATRRVGVGRRGILPAVLVLAAAGSALTTIGCLHAHRPAGHPDANRPGLPSRLSSRTASTRAEPMRAKPTHAERTRAEQTDARRMDVERTSTESRGGRQWEQGALGHAPRSEAGEVAGGRALPAEVLGATSAARDLQLEFGFEQ
jgi:hypothetical protein